MTTAVAKYETATTTRASQDVPVEFLESETMRMSRNFDRVAHIMSQFPQVEPGYFKGRYVHLGFDWFPFACGSPVFGVNPFKPGGFTRAMWELLPLDEVDAFIRAAFDATLRHEALLFLHEAFGEYPHFTLAQVREHAGMSIAEAARLSGVSERTIRRWERDGCASGAAIKIQRLCGVYGTSIDRISMQTRRGAGQ